MTRPYSGSTETEPQGLVVDASGGKTAHGHDAMLMMAAAAGAIVPSAGGPAGE